MIRQYALVKITMGMKKWLNDNGHTQSPLLQEDVFIFHGEIPNMPEHCVISGHKSGKIITGYDISNFVELSEAEV